MKTIKFIYTVALMWALLTTTAPGVVAQVNEASEYATTRADSAILNVVQTQPMQFKVVFDTPQSSKIAVRILDAQGEVLFNETRAVESGYLRYFDLSSLHDGTYTFEILDGKEKYNKSFDILTQTRRIVSSIK